MSQLPLIVNIKNWFRLIPTLEYHIQEDEDEIINIDYSFDVFSETKTKVEQAKDLIINLLNSTSNTALTLEDFINKTDLKKRTIERAIKELIENNKIESSGYTKNKKYTLK